MIVVEFEDGTKQIIPCGLDKLAGNELQAIGEMELRDGIFYTGESPVKLSRHQFAVVDLLMRAQGGVVAREKIIESVWDPFYRDDGVSKLAVDSLIGRTREKLKRYKTRCEIQAVGGRGYRLVERTGSSDATDSME